MYGRAAREIRLISEKLGAAFVVTVGVWNKSTPLSPVTIKAASSFSDSW